MSYSDIIEQLSYTTPLNTLAFYTTERIIAGQYSAITISFSSDQDTNIDVEFSNDGINFDIKITKNFGGGVNGYENLVILGKWMRFKITNISLNNQTYLRVYAYGSVQNTSLNALIQKVGNKAPEIDISESLPMEGFRDLRVGEINCLSNYVFNQGATDFMDNNDLQCPYPDIKVKSFGAFGPKYRFTDGMITLENNNTPNSIDEIEGIHRSYRSGLTMVYRYTMKFDTSTDADKKYGMFIGVASGGSWGAAAKFGFGWFNLIGSVPRSYNDFGLIYNDYVGQKFVLRTDWNIDKCDGTGEMPTLDLSKIQVVQMTFTYLGSGPIDYYIMSPIDGKFKKVHSVKLPNNQIKPTLSSPSLSFYMGISMPSATTATTGNASVSCGSFCSFSVGNRNTYIEEISYNTSKTSVSSEAVVANFKNTFYSYPNGSLDYSAIVINKFRFSVDGTKNVIIRGYKNATIGGSPVYSYINSKYSKTQVDTSGTYTTSTGIQVFCYELGKTDKINFSDDSIILDHNETLSITAESSANTDVFLSASTRTD